MAKGASGDKGRWQIGVRGEGEGGVWDVVRVLHADPHHGRGRDPNPDPNPSPQAYAASVSPTTATTTSAALAAATAAACREWLEVSQLAPCEYVTEVSGPPTPALLLMACSTDTMPRASSNTYGPCTGTEMQG